MRTLIAAIFAPRHWKKRLPFLLIALVLSAAFFVHQGQRYYRERVVLRDLRNIHTAGEWYRYGADRNVREAQYNLGLLYQRGFTVPQSDQEAARWMTRAADQDFGPAQNELGVYYETGAGVPRDPVKAAALYGKAIGHGSIVAMDRLAGLYQNGTGVEKNHVLAAGLYERAAAAGYIPAQLNLAKLYMIDKDLVRAYAWASLAEAAASSPGQLDLAHALLSYLLAVLDPVRLAEARVQAGVYIDRYGAATRGQFLNVERR